MKSKVNKCDQLSFLSEVEKDISEIKKSTLYEINREYKKTISVLESEILNLNSNNFVLSEKNYNLVSQINSLKCNLKAQQSVKSKYKSMNKNLKFQNKQITSFLTSENESEKLKLREDSSSHRYSDAVRRCYYALQGEGNVSASNCSKVVLQLPESYLKLI